MSIRVLFPFSGHIVGGSHISALTLIQNLPNDIEPVIGVFTLGPLTRYLDERNIPWIRMPDIQIATTNLTLIKELSQLISCCLPLRHFLKANKIDILHTHEYNMHCLWSLAKTGAPIKHIWHQRSLNNSRRLALYAPFVDYYLTISDFCRDHLVGLIKNRAEVLPNPVQITASDMSATVDLFREVGITQSEPVIKIGFIGHLDKQKRILKFIEIAALILQAKSPKTKTIFFIFGEKNTEYGQKVQNEVKASGIQNSCFLMGTRFPISPWIKELNLLVAPAANEGLGRSIIEAQMLGVPVVASNHGGHKELIRNGETGWLAPLDDTQAFTDIILNVIHDPDRRNTTCSAAKTAAWDKFSVAAHVSRVSDIYRSLKSKA